MRICLLRAAPGQEDDPRYSDIELFTDRHTFEQRFISKDTIKQDLNFAAAESFDLYFNFLHWTWYGSDNKEVAILAAKYIEYLAIPVIGLPSRVLEKYGLDEDGRLVIGDLDTAQGEDITSRDKYSCTIIELDNTPIPLCPVFAHTEIPLKSTSSPVFLNAIQKLTEDAFYANDLHGTFWCTFLVHLNKDSKPTLTGITPMPKTIFPFAGDGKNSAAEACAVRQSFPGSYRSLIHSLIASYFLKRNRNIEVSRQVGQEFDTVASKYDAVTAGIYHEGLKGIVQKYNFDGVVLDIACGTGLVARLHGDTQNRSRFIGMDISLQMKTECLRHGLYSSVLVGPMQRLLIVQRDTVHHVICIGAFLFLESNELSLVLSRIFQLATASVTFTIDEIPDSYNKAQTERGRGHMAGFNHLDEVERFGIPVGWKLADRWRFLGWTSPTTGSEIYSNVFRFEALQE